ncbi:hypothetical protein H8959_006662 [Pygathrix nigripes]
MLLPLACLHRCVAQRPTSLLLLAEPLPRPRRGVRARGGGPQAPRLPPRPHSRRPPSQQQRRRRCGPESRAAQPAQRPRARASHTRQQPPGEPRMADGARPQVRPGYLSSVFYAMFYGDLAEVKSEIHIPDVEPAAFLILLKYVYSDEIDLEADMVLATLYAAKKYIVPALAKACINFLETSLKAKNTCVLLSQSRLFEEPKLTQRCWEAIDAQAEMVLRSEGFCEIDRQTLEIIITWDPSTPRRRWSSRPS